VCVNYYAGSWVGLALGLGECPPSRISVAERFCPSIVQEFSEPENVLLSHFWLPFQGGMLNWKDLGCADYWKDLNPLVDTNYARAVLTTWKDLPTPYHMKGL
jgi:hypothetical protein